MFEQRNFNSPVEHRVTADSQMRDTTELDNLSDDIRRNLKGEAVVMPWQVGRPLRSAGMDTATGMPLTPLAALDLAATVPPEVANRLASELGRAKMVDAVGEGVLDHAERLGVPLMVEETQEEADERAAEERGGGNDKVD